MDIAMKIVCSVWIRSMQSMPMSACKFILSTDLLLHMNIKWLGKGIF